MGIVQYFLENGKPSNRATIDGVTVTEQNEQELRDKNVRRQAINILYDARSKIAYLWSGLKEFPERDRILSIVDKTINDLKNA